MLDRGARDERGRRSERCGTRSSACAEVAAAASAAGLWLYTWTADPLYARLGWERVGLECDTTKNIEVVLMKRDLR